MTPGYTFCSRRVCEGGNHVKAYACRFDFGPLIFSLEFMITRFQISRFCDFGPFNIIASSKTWRSREKKCSDLRFWSIFDCSNGPKSKRHAYAFTWLPPSHTFLGKKVYPRLWGPEYINFQNLWNFRFLNTSRDESKAIKSKSKRQRKI